MSGIIKIEIVKSAGVTQLERELTKEKQNKNALPRAQC